MRELHQGVAWTHAWFASAKKGLTCQTGNAFKPVSVQRHPFTNEEHSWPRTSVRWRTATSCSAPQHSRRIILQRRIVLRGRRRCRRPRHRRGHLPAAPRWVRGEQVAPSWASRGFRLVRATSWWCRTATSPPPSPRGGEPVGAPGNMPAFKFDASNSAADQAVQMGMHHDGVEFFPVRGQFNPGPDRHQPRIHRRRPAARGRLQQHQRREGEEVAKRPRPVGQPG